MPSAWVTLAILVYCSLEPRCHRKDASVMSDGRPSANKIMSVFQKLKLSLMPRWLSLVFDLHGSLTGMDGRKCTTCE